MLDDEVPLSLEFPERGSSKKVRYFIAFMSFLLIISYFMMNNQQFISSLRLFCYFPLRLSLLIYSIDNYIFVSFKRKLLVFGFLISEMLFAFNASKAIFTGFAALTIYFIFDRSFFDPNFNIVSKFDTFSFSARGFNSHHKFYYYSIGFIIYMSFVASLSKKIYTKIIIILITSLVLIILSRKKYIIYGFYIETRMYITILVFTSEFFLSLFYYYNTFSLLLLQFLTTGFFHVISFIKSPLISFESNSFSVYFKFWERKSTLTSIQFDSFVIIPSWIEKHGIKFYINKVSIGLRDWFGDFLSVTDDFGHPIKSKNMKLSFDYDSRVTNVNFLFLTNFDSVFLPKSLRKITRCGIAPCNCTFSASVDPENEYFHNETNLLIQNFPQVIIRCSIHARRALIREGVTKIDYCAFSYCHLIKSIRIPSSVTEIGYKAFYRCYGLSSVTFAPNSQLRQIRKFSFMVTALKRIIIPPSIEAIEYGSLAWCPFLSRIEISNLNNNLFKLENNIVYGSFKSQKLKGNIFEMNFRDSDMNSPKICLVNFPIDLIKKFQIEDNMNFR